MWESLGKSVIRRGLEGCWVVEAMVWDSTASHVMEVVRAAGERGGLEGNVDGSVPLTATHFVPIKHGSPPHTGRPCRCLQQAAAAYLPALSRS